MDGLNPLRFEPGCNTPADVIRAQFVRNVERDVPWLERGEPKERPLAIVAGGPSLKDRWDEIKTLDADVMALNGAYQFLLDRWITPDYFMLLDARPENVEFVRQTSDDTMHLIAAQCHPDVFDALSGDNVTLYLTTLDYAREATAHIDKPKTLIAGSVGTVGFKALCMAYALGYRELHLFGYDSSYAESHHAFPQALNDGANTIDVHLSDGRKFITTPSYAHQASEFPWFASGMVRHYGMDIQLHCAGLLPALVEIANKEGEIPLEERERAKYVTMWNSPMYRKMAPGEDYVSLAIDALGMEPGDTVIDFGCGTGRGAQALQDRGMQVTAVDFAPNCLDAGITVPFVQGCLWDLPDIRADWGYCTDVMEHIPTEKVGDVLRNIAERVKGCFFVIATRDDSLGWIAGKKLHLSVLTADQWRQLMGGLWQNVTVVEGDGGVIVTAS